MHNRQDGCQLHNRFEGRERRVEWGTRVLGAPLAVGGAVLAWGVPDDGRLGIAPLPDDIVWLPTAVDL